jgi:hypothetical protein
MFQTGLVGTIEPNPPVAKTGRTSKKTFGEGQPLSYHFRQIGFVINELKVHEAKAGLPHHGVPGALRLWPGFTTGGKKEINDEHPANQTHCPGRLFAWTFPTVRRHLAGIAGIAVKPLRAL